MEKEYDFSRMTVGDAQRLNEEYKKQHCQVIAPKTFPCSKRHWYSTLDGFDMVLAITLFLFVIGLFVVVILFTYYDFTASQTCVNSGRTYTNGICIESAKAGDGSE